MSSKSRHFCILGHGGVISNSALKKGGTMEAMGILGFVFGLIAFVRIEKLTKTLKEKRILEENYKEE
jgi:hypothetical protein